MHESEFPCSHCGHFDHELRPLGEWCNCVCHNMHDRDGGPFENSEQAYNIGQAKGAEEHRSEILRKAHENPYDPIHIGSGTWLFPRKALDIEVKAEREWMKKLIEVRRDDYEQKANEAVSAGRKADTAVYMAHYLASCQILMDIELEYEQRR